MGCMGMEEDMDNRGQQESTSIMPPSICQLATYLDYRIELELSPDQIEKLQKLVDDCQKEIITKEAEIKTAGIDYQAKFRNMVINRVPSSTVEAKGREIGELYSQIFLVPLHYQKMALVLLTDRQRDRLKNISSYGPKTDLYRR